MPRRDQWPGQRHRPGMAVRVGAAAGGVSQQAIRRCDRIRLDDRTDGRETIRLHGAGGAGGRGDGVTRRGCRRVLRDEAKGSAGIRGFTRRDRRVRRGAGVAGGRRLRLTGRFPRTRRKNAPRCVSFLPFSYGQLV